MLKNPSAGSVIKKVVEINPELGVREIAQLIRQGTSFRPGLTLEQMDVETIDEERVLELARATVVKSQGATK